MFASFTSDLPWQYCNNEFNDGWAAIWGEIQMWNRSVKRADSEQWFTVTKPGAHLRIVQELLLRDCVQGVRGDEGELDWQQHHLPQQVKRCHYHLWQGDEQGHLPGCTILCFPQNQVRDHITIVTGHVSLRRVCWPHSERMSRSGMEAQKRWFYNQFTTFPASK